MKTFKQWSEAFYGKVTLAQINSYLRGMRKRLSKKELTDYLKKYFNLKKIEFNPQFTKILAIEELEIKKK